MRRSLNYIAAAFLFSGMLSAQNIDINKMPVATSTPVVNITKPKTFTMKNGLTVMVVENNKLPRVSMNLSMDRPPYYEGDIVGVSEIMADQFENGTKNMSKEDFNKKVDYLGANLSFSSGGAFANTLSKYFPQVLSLMADAVVNPKFSATEVQNSKERTIEGLKANEKNASSIASRVSRALRYGKNTARGEFETIESINKVTLADVQDVYKKYYAPDNAYLVVVGDVKYNTVKPLIEKAFANWKKSNTVYPELEPAKNPSTAEINVVDVPTAVQSVVSVGNVNNLQMRDPQYFAAMLANYILGGGADSRLFMNLREKNAFTYGAYSNMNSGKYSSDFTAQASVRNEVTDKAVKEFMNELNAISTVTPQELANAKAKLKGDFIRSLERPETIARFAVSQKVRNLPDNFYTNYLKSIDAVTAEQVSQAVKQNILTGQSRIFVAGKGADIADGLEKLGYPVKYYDRFANPAAKPSAQAVPANVTVATIGDNYIKAIGGSAAVNKINSITMKAGANVQGMALDLNMMQAKGGKMAQTISMMGQTVQRMVFDGKTGYAEAQGRKMDLPAEALADMAGKTVLFPELNFPTDKSYQVTGIEKFNGEDSYVVKKGADTYYYSVKTGLKTGEVKTQKSMSIPTSYSDYKEVAGVKMPYKFTQTMMGQEIVFDVKSYEVNQAKDTDFK